MTAVRLVVPSQDECGEASLWDPKAERLYWLDLYRPTLHILDPATREHAAYPVDGPDLLACLLHEPGAPLPLLVSRNAIGRMTIAGDRVSFRASRDLDIDTPREAVNDGKTHPSGTVWLGTADTEETAPLGRLEAFRGGKPPVLVDRGFVVSNGPAFSPDGRWAYFSDSATRRVLRYPVAADGLPDGAAETLAVFSEEEGNPDGMTVDTEGLLWVAMWDGACVRRLDPAGRTIAVIELPVPRATSCAFGGADFATLFITTAATGLDAAAREAGAGGLFVAEPGVRGLPEPVARP
ncbi:MAG: SMP-30/gluconolactonase/LRE family protein [Bauldia sp.]|nr:SMP-30/gluconolactonase/LRE family protein [Bauldia sp.]